MDPITMSLVSGGLQILGGIEANRKNTAAAKAQYYSNKPLIERDYAVQQSGLQDLANETNAAIGMQLTDLVYSTLSAQGTLGATTAETGAFGNTALRKQNVLAMRTELAKDKIIQQGEASMVELQNKMREVKYATEDKHQQNLDAFNNRMAQNKSPMELMLGGISAGMQGYSAGQSLAAGEAQLNAANTAINNAKAINAMKHAQLTGLLPHL